MLAVRLLVGCLVLAALAITARGLDPTPAPNPVTIKEICEGLRAGTSSNDLAAAVTARRLLDSPKPTDEANMRAAGASPHLLEVLKSGNYTLSPFDANDARRRMAQAAAVPAPAVAPAAAGHMADLLRGKMVTCQQGLLQGYNDGKLAGKKYYALYYSAEWCPPCRKFTPKLVQFDDRVAAQHPEVEVIFFSNDKGPAEMQKYMQDDKMPWPAVRFEQVPKEKELMHYRGNGIPCLVLVDADSKVIADTFVDGKYMGPSRVANELARLLGVPPLPPS